MEEYPNVQSDTMYFHIALRKVNLPSSNGGRLWWSEPTLAKRLYYFSVKELLVNKSVMLCILTINVDALCSNADVVGGKIPITPSAIRLALKDMIKR